MIWAPVIWDITIFEKNTKKSCLFSRKIYYHRHLGKIVSLVIFEAFTHVWIRRAICLFLRMSIVDRFQILHKCPNFHYVLKILSLQKFWVNLVCWYFMKYRAAFFTSLEKNQFHSRWNWKAFKYENIHMESCRYSMHNFWIGISSQEYSHKQNL